MQLIEEFWYSQGMTTEDGFIPNLPSENRCEWCCRFFRRAQDLKAHHTRGCPARPGARAGSKSERAVQRERRRALQADAARVHMGTNDLESVLDFGYLGSDFDANGDSRRAITVRAAQAKSVFGKLHHIWSSDKLPEKAKLKLYSAGVRSVLVHGHESWDLDEGAQRSLRGWNARCLFRITGRSVAEECRQPTSDLVSRELAAGQDSRGSSGRDKCSEADLSAWLGARCWRRRRSAVESTPQALC